MRILVIRPGALGDVLLTLPALQALAAAYPHAAIELMGSLPVPEWLPGRSVVHTVSSFDRADLATLFGPDAVPAAGLQGYLDSFDLILSYATAPGHVFARNLARLARGRVLLLDGLPPEGDVHMSRYLQQPLRELGIVEDTGYPLLRVTTADREEAERWWAAHELDDTPAVAIHPGSGSPAKNWPAGRFAAVADHLQRERGARILLVGGPADGAAVDGVLQSLRDCRRSACAHAGRHPAPSGSGGTTARPHSDGPRRDPDPVLLQDMPLPLLAAVLCRCRLYVGNDSGVTHLAAALGVPAVAIFGPTDPRVWAPRGPAVRVVHSAQPCAPCTTLQRQACSCRACLEAVSVQTVLDAAGGLYFFARTSTGPCSSVRP